MGIATVSGSVLLATCQELAGVQRGEQPAPFALALLVWRVAAEAFAGPQEERAVLVQQGSVKLELEVGVPSLTSGPTDQPPVVRPEVRPQEAE